jgi:hypothetical protein
MMGHLPPLCQQMAQGKQVEGRLHAGGDCAPYGAGGRIEERRLPSAAITPSILSPNALRKEGLGTWRGLRDKLRLKEQPWHQTLREKLRCNVRGASSQDERLAERRYRIVEIMRLNGAGERRRKRNDPGGGESPLASPWILGFR